MICQNCKKEIPENSVACCFCGAPQGQANIPVQQPAPPKKNKTTTIIIAVIVSVIVAILAFVLGKFVIAPALAGDSEPTTENTQKVEAPTLGQPSIKDDVKDDVLTDLDFGLMDSRMFTSDMGEYGLLQFSFGFDSKTGLVKQMTAAVVINKTHPEYATVKEDANLTKDKIEGLNDKNFEFYVYDQQDGVKLYYYVKNLHLADRAERVELASEELDIPYNESNKAFYIDDIADTLINEYEFTEEE